MTKQLRLSSRFFSSVFLLAALMPGMATAGILTMTFSAQNSGSALGTAGGVELPNDSLVRLGVFNTDFATLQSNFNNQVLLEGFFDELARVFVGDFAGSTSYDSDNNLISYDPGSDVGIDGGFGHQVDFADATPYEGEKVYLWAVNSPTETGATEAGLFSDSSWVIPTGGTAPASMILELGEVRPLDAGDLYIATLGPEQATPNPDGLGGDLNKLVVVPEPGTGLLVLIGLGVGLLRRTRSN